MCLDAPRRCRQATGAVGGDPLQQPPAEVKPHLPPQPNVLELLSTHTSSDSADLEEAKDVELLRLRVAAEDDLEQAENMSYNLWSTAGAGQAPISPIGGGRALRAESPGRPRPLRLPLALWPCWEEAAGAYLLWERAARARVDAVIELQSVRTRMKEQSATMDSASASQDVCSSQVQDPVVEKDALDQTCVELDEEDLPQELTFQVYDYLDAETHAEEMRRQSQDAIKVLKLLTEPETVIRPLFEVTDRLENCMLSLRISGYQPGMTEWDLTQSQLNALEQEKSQYIASVAHLFTRAKAESFWQSARDIASEASHLSVEESMDMLLKKLMCE